MAPRLILRVKSKGLLFAGVPCDSMGFLSSPTHQRSALFPWGAPFPFVYTGNLLCCRFSMMVLISIARGVVWGLENPERTAINHVPPIDLILQSFLRPLTVKWHLEKNILFLKRCMFLCFIYHIYNKYSS